ncbi:MULTISPECIES: glutathione S-transferase family protein [unclassified Moraxella]|uniref:glutathione S-transferase family protein n=1 Tax=unclassified Moraxella TaxID=2685852 RepID=UPI003AF4BABE
MKLYAFKGACSFVPHTALNLTGTDYELALISHADAKTPEYLAKNPQGAVPLLEDGDFYLSQNVAILNYLDEQYPTANIFGSGDTAQRAKAQQWLSYANADVHKAFTPLFRPTAFIAEADLTDELKTKLTQTAIARLQSIYKIADDNLANQDYMAGEFSIADVYLYVTLRWANGMKIDLSNLKNLAKLVKNVEANPAVQKSLKEEGLDAIGQ